MEPVRLAAIVEALGGELHGDPERALARIAPIETAGPDAIAFLANARYLARLKDTAAGCVIVPPALLAAARARGDCIETADPYHYFARLTQWWAERLRPPATPGVHPSAVVDSSATIASDVQVGPLVVVEAGAVVGPRCVLAARAFVGAGARLGADSRLGVGAILGSGCSVGARAVIHGGVVIGADGFGFAPHGGRWVKIEQLGAVRIGDDVEIGANTCIDRGALDDTVIGDGVKLDNLIQVGHNVRIGDHTAMAGCVGIAGSATIGAHCTVGGGAVILGHLQLADHVHVSAATVVTRSILAPGTYSGVFPFDENSAWEKNAATLRQLHDLRARVRALEKHHRPT